MLLKTQTAPASTSESIRKATGNIPPLWPLKANVAVNPFLGSNRATLSETSKSFAGYTGHSLLMPRAWFADKLKSGEILDEDIEAAIETAADGTGLTPDGVRARLDAPEALPERAATLLDLAAEHTRLNLSAIMSERITAWASNYFDEGQALWYLFDKGRAWPSWRSFALDDLSPEILGLDGFARFADKLPESATDFVEAACSELGLPPAAAESYFTQLLLELGGWSQLGRYRHWTAGQAGEDDMIVGDLLAIRLAWELYAYRTFKEKIALAWTRACRRRLKSMESIRLDPLDEVLQLSLDHAAQRRLARTLADQPEETATAGRPGVQAAFCIDVRSEVFRRALESVDESVETLGFAGFFGLGVDHQAFASDVHEKRLPVLLSPALQSCETDHENAAKDRAKRYRARAVRAWGRFKLAAVSSFAFVESAGPIYISKLILGSLGIKAGRTETPPLPNMDPSVSLQSRTEAAETILRAMSLTSNFAHLVLMIGHGADVRNNPHASALQCGACGGYAGDVNARLLAGLLNDADVRAGLRDRGIEIPADTHFVGGLHDTTSDRVTLYDDQPSAAHAKQIEAARGLLETAGVRARSERSPRLPRSTGPRSVLKRGRSWSQTRPEWGLAGCSAFIAAPRARTAGSNLAGRSFLHSYDWREDKDFRVLELILTAPVVVASWISLQYYGSTVAPAFFGAGNKLLHNVVGGVGVLEGNGGPLRSGLPIQSVNDGRNAMHEPVRLSVCIEAPREAISEVLDAHPDVKALFDNRWLHLFAMNDAGELAWRYAGDGHWRPGFTGAQAGDLAA